MCIFTIVPELLGKVSIFLDGKKIGVAPDEPEAHKRIVRMASIGDRLPLPPPDRPGWVTQTAFGQRKRAQKGLVGAPTPVSGHSIDAHFDA